MSGFTVRAAEGIIDTGSTSSQIQSGKMKKEMLGPVEGGQKTFADTLSEAVNDVNELQKVADKKMEDLATGRAKSIPDVMIATEKADIALKLMVQVRNKIIDAYQEVMKMQV
jgi:flagellar hook-basal body complex protein FliE